ncbi:MAG: membrane integrity-associated transporter subunit PqiC [Nitrosomonadales bacterium]|nr:membrane integrity-associated transporter subunit PqiC [Nitrosomonadales bacterium]
MKPDDMAWYTRFAAMIPTATMLALLAGCSSLLPPPPPPASIYLLDIPALADLPRSVSSPKRDIVLEVAAPKARAGFDTARMVWVRRTHGLEVYSSNRWADAPARMLAPLLVQALGRSGTFRAVVSSPSGASASLRLDTELIRLQQDFGTQPSKVRFTLGAQLVDIGDRRVIATAEFDEVEDCVSEDAYGGVLAANRALERLLARISDFCAEHVR